MSVDNISKHNARCETCGKSFRVRPWLAPKRRYCTWDCRRHPVAVAQRFWSKVRKGDGCWDWTAGLFTCGYGQVTIGRKNQYAHRVSWEMHYGKIPVGKIVCHKCDNPLCVRPDHLFVGTYQDNSDDMVRKGRKVVGDKIPWAKLNPDSVKEIRQKYANGVSMTKLAKEKGMALNAIWKLVHRITWASVP